MATVLVEMDIPNKLYAEIMTGSATLMGMVKDSNNHRIKKHIKLVPTTIKEQALQILKANKNLFIGIGGAIVLLVIGLLTYHKLKKKNKKYSDKEVLFANSLKTYLEETKEGKLKYQTLCDLINVLNEIINDKNYSIKNFNLSKKQLNQLTKSIFSYTERLAKANHIKLNNFKKPSKNVEGNIINLNHYLTVQKDIFEKTS